ncbi:hypothetical protein LCGC14_1289060 [marine sediment metagenome]|uniref:SHSP domain-containing protein n=1 Tax=marine sediment metagenome TaxID=412755 RepID=A0A0F9NVZ3_9ZZZZ
MNVPLQVAEENFFSAAGQMSRWLDRVLGPDYQRYRGRGCWTPPINLYEVAGAFFLVVDLAGIDPEAVDLRVEDGRLILRGQRPSPRPAECEQDDQGMAAGALRLHLMEIDHGPFLRVLELPETASTRDIEARYRSGFLWVRIPKVVKLPEGDGK